MRGYIANIRIRNQIAPGTEGGFSTYWPTNEVTSMYDACMNTKEDGTGLVVLAVKITGWDLLETGQQKVQIFLVLKQLLQKALNVFTVLILH